MDLISWMDVLSAGVNFAPFVKTKARCGEQVCSKVGQRSFTNWVQLDRTGTQTLTFTYVALFPRATSQHTALDQCSEAPVRVPPFVCRWKQVIDLEQCWEAPVCVPPFRSFRF